MRRVERLCLRWSAMQATHRRRETHVRAENTRDLLKLARYALPRYHRLIVSLRHPMPSPRSLPSYKLAWKCNSSGLRDHLPTVTSAALERCD